MNLDSSTAYGKCLEVWLLIGNSVFAQQSPGQNYVSLPLPWISALESECFLNPWLCAGVTGPILLWALKLQPLSLRSNRSPDVPSCMFSTLAMNFLWENEFGYVFNSLFHYYILFRIFMCLFFFFWWGRRVHYLRSPYCWNWKSPLISTLTYYVDMCFCFLNVVWNNLLNLESFCQENQAFFHSF